MKEVCALADGILFAIRVAESVPDDVAMRAAMLYSRMALAGSGPSDESEHRRMVSESLCRAFEDLRGLAYERVGR